MSNGEILAELRALSSSELEAVWQTAGQLLEGRTLNVSPELLAAVDEADASWEQEGGVAIEEVRRKSALDLESNRRTRRAARSGRHSQVYRAG